MVRVCLHELAGGCGGDRPSNPTVFEQTLCFFGHSMGACIRFELAQLLHQTYTLTPECLFLSGRRAPQL